MLIYNIKFAICNFLLQIQRIVISVPDDNIASIYPTVLKDLELDFDNITTAVPKILQILETWSDIKAFIRKVKQDSNSFYRYKILILTIQLF